MKSITDAARRVHRFITQENNMLFRRLIGASLGKVSLWGDSNKYSCQSQIFLTTAALSCPSQYLNVHLSSQHFMPACFWRNLGIISKRSAIFEGNHNNNKINDKGEWWKWKEMKERKSRSSWAWGETWRRSVSREQRKSFFVRGSYWRRERKLVNCNLENALCP